MVEISERQWADFAPRLNSFRCPVCGGTYLRHSERRYGELGGIDVLMLTCPECGRIELFDVAEVCRYASRMDKKFRDQGNR